MPPKMLHVAEPMAAYAVTPISMPHVFNMHAAKTQFSRLVDQAVAGQEIFIAKAGKPVARLVALEEPRRGVRIGLADGKFHIPDDFDDPLPDELWNGSLVPSEVA